MSTEFAPTVDGPIIRTPAPTTKQEVIALIGQAASGDQRQIERLLTPFLTPGERILWAGLTAKMGLLRTYNFAFLTDRRVGDLQVTPFTGDLNVEVCYLQHIDATVISQPSITLALWSWIIGGYPLCFILGMGFPMFSIGPLTHFDSEVIPFILVFGLVLSLGMIVGWTLLGIPMMKRWILLHRKSGVWFKLRASTIGSLVFADRDKFAVLTQLVQMVSEQKRLFDQETR